LNGTVVHLDPDAHQALAELLPWYVTDRLAPEQRAAVETHLAGCARCQAEVESERRLRSLAAVPGAPVDDADAAFARLRRQIEAERAGGAATEDGAAGRRAPRAGGAWRAWAGWLPWVAGLQAALILCLGVALSLLLVSTTPTYRGLGAPSAAASAGNAVVKFRPDATDAQVRAALNAAGARIVNGPTVSDAYVLSLPPADIASAIQRLRSDRAVVLAESLEERAVP
jgi:anti-sigma factor RsiW